MSLTTTEYALHHLEGDEIRSIYGPYDTFEMADIQRKNGERSTSDGFHKWVVMERDVTPWIAVPKNSHDWPDDD